jgi:hypothetical protein
VAFRYSVQKARTSVIFQTGVRKIMGKGDKPRPLSVSYDEYSKRWEDIFGKNDPEEEELEPCPCGSDEPCE